MNSTVETGPGSSHLDQGEIPMLIEACDFEQKGLYLLFPRGKRIVLTREKIDRFVHTFEANLDQIPAGIRNAAAFQACPVCPERGRAKFCHALPATLAFMEELRGFNSYARVGAVYRGAAAGLVWVPDTTMHEALQFVALLSLMYYCELGRKYWKFFLGIHPLLSPTEMMARIHLNIYWDCKGDQQLAEKVTEAFANEITCTCRCQVKRLGLVCSDDALITAFVRVQSQIEYLAIGKSAALEQSFEDYLKA
jgi:hypothetical protein